MNERQFEVLRNSMLASINNLLAFVRRHDYQKTAESLDLCSNWHLVVSAGTLLLLLNNMNDFVVAGTMPHKYLYLSSLVFLGASTSAFALARTLLLARRSHLDSITDYLEKCRSVLENRPSEPEPLPEDLLSDLDAATQVIPVSSWLIKPGVISFLLGLALAISYVLIFVIRYL